MRPLLTILLLATCSTAALAAPTVSPLNEEYPLLRELARLGAAPRLSGHALSAGDVLLGTSAAEVGALATPTSAAELLAKWAPPHRDQLGLWLRPFANVFALTTDPHRQLRPIYEDVRKRGAVDPAWRYQLGALVDARLHPRLERIVQSRRHPSARVHC